MIRRTAKDSFWILSVWTFSILFLTAPGLAAPPELADVFVGNSEGYHTFRIPAIIATKKGTLLAFCEGRKTGRGDHGDLDLVLRRSDDGGRTWGPLELIYEEGGEKKITIGNPSPVVDQSTGMIWLPFTRDNDDVLITSSSDNGKTWSKPRDITHQTKDPSWDWYATGPGNAIQLTRGKHKGRLLIPCDHRIKNSGDWNQAGQSHIIYSDDHGKSWRLGGSTSGGMNECAAVELVDGSIMLNMRNYRKRGHRAVALSRDGGLTWSEPVEDQALIESVCQASFIRYGAVDSTGDSAGKNRLLFSNPASQKSRDHLTVRMSYDEGKTWPVARLLYEGSAAYSNLITLPSGEIGVLFERDNYSKISFARLTLDWLTDSKKSPAR